MFVSSFKYIFSVFVGSAIISDVFADNLLNFAGDNADFAFLNDSYDQNKWRGENCVRSCILGAPPRICYFKFVLENYHVMGPACRNCIHGQMKDCFIPDCITADGVQRGVMSINRQIPGPEINVCKGDLIVVDVENQMQGTSSTIHWHGLHQYETPFMDGVPFITQCPIPFSTEFRYAFKATEPGTQFYHSHSGHHKVNGHFGALIVREPKETDPNANQYDLKLPEHIILAADWMHEMAEMLMPGYPAAGGIFPTSILINGRGQFNSAPNALQTPLQVYRVQAKSKYRFRFINSASHFCLLQLQIEDHRLKIIATDSFAVKPRIVDTLIAGSGERYDFVLDTNQGSKVNYFIRVRAIGPCTDLRIEQFAILSYAPSSVPDVTLSRPTRQLPTFEEPFPPGVYLNHPNTTCDWSKNICVSKLQRNYRKAEAKSEMQAVNTLINIEPDYSYVLSFDNYFIEDKTIYQRNHYMHFINVGPHVNLMGAINNVSFTFPSFPLLSQPGDIIESAELLTFCDDYTKPPHCANLVQCPCTHRLKVKLNSTVELIIIDETTVIRPMNHPFHLHGHAFYVMAMGQPPFGAPITSGTARSISAAESIQNKGRNTAPPLKDTILIPSHGFARIRFRANNPGFWFLHCHFDWHLAIGMALVFQVGETSEMKPSPADFPKCSSYRPPIKF